MAIPGSPLEARSHGCNHLIREGAVLVQSPDDVVELLTGFDGRPRSTFREPVSPFDFEPAEMAGAEPAGIASLLTTAPVAIDELIRQSGESAAAPAGVAGAGDCWAAGATCGGTGEFILMSATGWKAGI